MWDLQSGYEKAVTVTQGSLFASSEKNVATLFPYHENSKRQTVIPVNECVLPSVIEEQIR